MKEKLSNKRCKELCDDELVRLRDEILQELSKLEKPIAQYLHDIHHPIVVWACRVYEQKTKGNRDEIDLLIIMLKEKCGFTQPDWLAIKPLIELTLNQRKNKIQA
jgi:hypothetical protein